MSLMQLNLNSQKLLRTILLYILVPEKCLQEKERKALFLLHDYGQSPSCWLTKVNLERLAQKTNAIIIMPEDENRFYIDDRESNDLYTGFVGEELPGYLRKILGLSHDPADWSIAGLAGGGYAAIRIGALYPKIFGTVLAVDPLIIDDNYDADLRRLSKYNISEMEAETIIGTAQTIEEDDVNLKRVFQEGFSGELCIVADTDDPDQEMFLSWLDQKDIRINRMSKAIQKNTEGRYKALLDIIG